jgi:hypothetical protein
MKGEKHPDFPVESHSTQERWEVTIVPFAYPKKDQEELHIGRQFDLETESKETKTNPLTRKLEILTRYSMNQSETTHQSLHRMSSDQHHQAKKDVEDTIQQWTENQIDLNLLLLQSSVLYYRPCWWLLVWVFLELER